jgi:hypothetical protein
VGKDEFDNRVVRMTAKINHDSRFLETDGNRPEFPKRGSSANKNIQ